MNWLGALLTLASSYFCGIMLANGEAEMLSAYDSLIHMLEYMRRRMVAERLQLYRIFDGFEDDYLESIGFLKRLRSSRHGLDSLWRSAIEALPTDKETRSELLHFGESLGALPLDEQIKRIDSLSSFLTEKRVGLNGSLAQKRKSIKALCLLTGALVSIILL